MKIDNALTRFLLAFVLMACFSAPMYVLADDSQGVIPPYEDHSMMIVPRPTQDKLQQFYHYGFDIVQRLPDSSFKIVATMGEREILESQFGGVVEIENLEEHYREHLATDKLMGGYRTYSETRDELFAFQANYPDIVRVDTIGFSLEGRPIYGVKVSTNVNVDEDEAEVMLNGLIHAREPITNELIMYFLYYITWYNWTPMVQPLLDNAEIWLVPIINVDGFVYNETSNPEGGGMWRKNLRDNGDGTFGVDLNRNFDPGWGWNDIGSSSDGGSQVYRGTAPFSEPESQVMVDFMNAHDFCVVINYHAFGNFIEHPMSFVHNPYNADATIMTNIGNGIVERTGYNFGIGYWTTGPNGPIYDWEYGEQFDKKKIYAWLVEVGPSFWPPSNQIEDLCESLLQSNLFVVQQAIDVWQRPTRSVATTFTHYDTTLDVCVQPYTETASFHNVDDGEPLSFTFEVQDGGAATDWFSITAPDTTIDPGESVEVTLEFDPSTLSTVAYGEFSYSLLLAIVSNQEIPPVVDTLVYFMYMTRGMTDPDNDDIDAPCDNCPFSYNPNQLNSDSDSLGDSCDNCPLVTNPGQDDDDLDGVGNVCDLCPGYDDLADADGDTVADSCDNCPDMHNPGQLDTDDDGIGDVCEACCVAQVGNVDADIEDLVDVSDLTLLIGHLFINYEPLECPAEGNTDGDIDCAVDISDLTVMISHLFISYDPLPDCNLDCEVFDK